MRNVEFGSSRAGIVAPSKKDRLGGTGCGPGNRSELLVVYFGARANQKSESLPGGQAGAGSQSSQSHVAPHCCRVRTGHLRLWLSIQSEAWRSKFATTTALTAARTHYRRTSIPDALYTRHATWSCYCYRRPSRAHLRTRIHPDLTPSPGTVAVGRIHHGQNAHAHAPLEGSASEEPEQTGGQPMRSDHVISFG